MQLKVQLAVPRGERMSLTLEAVKEVVWGAAGVDAREEARCVGETAEAAEGFELGTGWAAAAVAFAELWCWG